MPILNNITEKNTRAAHPISTGKRKQMLGTKVRCEMVQARGHNERYI